MTDMKRLRAAIGAALRDPNFMAEASLINGAPLRKKLGERLTKAGLDVEVLAAIASGDMPPYYQADIVWREGADGELTHQTIKWDIAPWSFALDHFHARPSRQTH